MHTYLTGLYKVAVYGKHIPQSFEAGQPFALVVTGKELQESAQCPQSCGYCVYGKYASLWSAHSLIFRPPTNVKMPASIAVRLSIMVSGSLTVSTSNANQARIAVSTRFSNIKKHFSPNKQYKNSTNNQ